MRNELIERIDTILSEAATDDEARVVTLLQIIKESLSKQEAQEPISLEWSEEKEGNEECRYNYVTAETPFGRFRITWKGWKEHDSPTIDETPWGDWFASGVDLEDAKRMAEEEYYKRLTLCHRSHCCETNQLAKEQK